MEPVLSSEPAADASRSHAADERMDSPPEIAELQSAPAPDDEPLIHVVDPEAHPEEAEVEYLADVHTEPPPTDLNMTFADLGLIRGRVVVEQGADVATHGGIVAGAPMIPAGDAGPSSAFAQ